MYFVLTRRELRASLAADPKDKYAARHTTRMEWAVSGPFERPQGAEAAAVQALGATSCLAAQIVNKETLQAIALASYSEQPDEMLGSAARKAVKWLT
jgi:hypothetical protein